MRAPEPGAPDWRYRLWVVLHPLPSEVVCYALYVVVGSAVLFGLYALGVGLGWLVALGLAAGVPYGYWAMPWLSDRIDEMADREAARREEGR